MSTYAIGDLQGCYREFRQLLDLIGFDPARHRLWLVGDLVNRGPDSLALLRFVKGLGEAAVTVLGNHDLHLLMVAGGHEKLRKHDTIRDLLAAPDRDELLDWLRRQKMLHAEGDYAMVHAGLLPSWSVAKALDLAREVEAVLRGKDFDALCAHMYGNLPDRWRDDLAGYDRMRVIINAMTRLRICTPEGAMEFHYTGKLPHIPAGYLPWFEVPERASRGATVVCGHWSALGLRLAPGLIALDSGCLWGGELSAVRLEDRRVFQVACAAPPGTKRWR
ncbi:MAG: symmetrical bis(5'-nucleosyl)-tetraphosphatase [Betaproteobacteria bacterium]|nr:symmetrical bis(5'-nucleosyl)-tetraphosphatase [Betaproteobacteria bacterium]